MPRIGGAGRLGMGRRVDNIIVDLHSYIHVLR